MRRVLDTEAAAHVEISAVRVTERARQYHGVRNDLTGFLKAKVMDSNRNWHAK
jgi:hypothetical protein